MKNERCEQEDGRRKNEKKRVRRKPKNGTLALCTLRYGVVFDPNAFQFVSVSLPCTKCKNCVNSFITKQKLGEKKMLEISLNCFNMKSVLCLVLILIYSGGFTSEARRLMPLLIDDNQQSRSNRPGEL